MGNAMYETQDIVYRSAIERASQDTANALLKTSGDPYNWENLTASQVRSVGMAKYDPTNKLPMEYVLSIDKVGAVTPTRVQNLLGSQYSFQLLITTLDLNTGTWTSGDTIRDMTSAGNTKTKETASDVVAVERIVLVSEFDIVAEFKNIRLTAQPQTLTQYFPTNKAYLDAFDYYVYVDNSDRVSSGWVEVNGVTGVNRVVQTSDFPSPPPLVRYIDPVTQKLKNETDLQQNRVQTRLAGSPGDTADVYVIKVPKGTPIEKINPENVNGVKARFVLYVWSR